MADVSAASGRITTAVARTREWGMIVILFGHRRDVEIRL